MFWSFFATDVVDLKTGKNIFVNNAEYCEKVMGKGDYMRIVIMSLRGLFYDYKMVQDLKYKGKARGNKIMADIYYKNHEVRQEAYAWHHNFLHRRYSCTFLSIFRPLACCHCFKRFLGGGLRVGLGLLLMELHSQK